MGDSRPATPAEKARIKRGDYDTWVCDYCGDRANILGKDALMVGCAPCKERERVLRWMRREVSAVTLENDEAEAPDG